MTETSAPSDSISLSPEVRQENLQKLQHLQFDILVIGGGITGAGIVRDAALRGYRTALIEKDDFAAGTSSKSAKLVHGGFRYLKSLEFGLVHIRRTHLFSLDAKQAWDIHESVADRLGKYLGWSKAKKQAQIETYKSKIKIIQYFREEK
ncbi:FAD-dependent oxidoreductase [candidate division KSB1 bacterium]|nr:FAD-dependent oxidoreductase [candidate division KSB1 bacterium]MBL7095869.1 FAD-dependent oxidoreductase [candidate division KSB1 bacterium]